MKLSTLDYVFSILSDRKTQLDFAFILHLPDSLTAGALEHGALSAREKFPITNSFLYGRQWKPLKTIDHLFAVTSDAAAVESFMDKPFDLRVEAPYRQLLVQRTNGSTLVTRFHHAAADGLSAAMWISHQLQVALGEEPAALCSAAPTLKRTSTAVWRSRFAYSKPSTPLQTSTNKTSNRRRWKSFTFEGAILKQLCRRIGGFTYNDLLAACALEVLINWNASAKNGSQVGLWLPMNIRSESSSGFGNGTSRIRIYPRYDHRSSFVEKALEVRKQVKWCTENGEWVVPEVETIKRLPAWISASLLNTYLSTPIVDMGTAVFSHGESLAGGVGKGLQIAERIECVGLLQKRQRLAINGTTHRNETCLTFTYDPDLFCNDAITSLRDLYLEQIKLAHLELSKCVAA